MLLAAFTAFVGLMTLCAAIPAVLFLINLQRFRTPVSSAGDATPHVAVLIPARNEEANIAEAVGAVLANRGVELDVLVYDDASTDRTAEILRGLAAADPRVRWIEGVALPPGWNGKQHACWRLAQETAAPTLLFLDADVRVGRDAIARCVAQKKAANVALLSGFPRVLTVTWMERLLLPLVQFVLLGFLPMGRMRRTTIPAYAAGCGQFMLVDREAYLASGGHASIRASRHDGLMLPGSFREHGFHTDICDLTDLASVRMYSSAREVWAGLAKNASEGLGSPGRILPLTLLLILGQVMPVIAAALCVFLMISTAIVGATFDQPRLVALFFAAIAVATACSFLPRLISVRRFQQPLPSALLHPVGLAVLLAIQWYALGKKIMGSPIGWRGRV
ncbi:MAG TPA: glycosyltransferase [Acidobacteriaceae bacterium]|jgi:hypothetical protein